MVNAIPSQPALLPVGAVSALTVTLQEVSTGNSLSGGLGDDIYYVYSALDQVTEVAGQGADTIIAHADFALGMGQSVEQLTVALGSDGVALTGNDLANTLTSAADAADTLAGGGGNDVYRLYHSGDQVIEATSGGTDTIYAYANHVLAAGSAVETIYAMGAAGRSLTGNALANTFRSNATYADTMAGGAGNDRYYLYHSGDKVTEATSGGTDTIYAYANHVLAAGSAVETIYAMGSAGRSLTGNALANTFRSNADRADTMAGGAGNDRYYLYHSGDRVTEATSGGTDTIYAYANHVLASGSAVETIYAMGSAGRSLTGNTLANTFRSNADRADTMAGGAGNDRYYLYHSGDRVTEATSGGTDTIYAYANHVLAAGSAVETIYAMGAAGRSLTGNALANTFRSNAAQADTMAGGAGNDTYWLNNATDRVIEAANGGRDVIMTSVSYTLSNSVMVEEMRATGSSGLALTGNAQANTLIGGTRSDTLTGGGGSDRLFGGSGSGADRFVFRSTAESVVGSARDVIGDFVSGQDRIDVTAIDANTGLSGNQAFRFTTGPAANALWLTASSGQLIVRLDTNGDARADMEIGLTSAAKADFLL